MYDNLLHLLFDLFAFAFELTWRAIVNAMLRYVVTLDARVMSSLFSTWHVCCLLPIIVLIVPNIDKDERQGGIHVWFLDIVWGCSVLTGRRNTRITSLLQSSDVHMASAFFCIILIKWTLSNIQTCKSLSFVAVHEAKIMSLDEE